MSKTAESERLQALRALDLLDTEPEEAFDSLTDLAASLLGTRMAAVSLIDAGRQWFKSRINLDVSETPREDAFCDHAIREGALFHVPDATQDPRFVDNPLVTGAPHIRGYAGMPLSTPDGFRIGTLCVIDDKPLALSEADKSRLIALAKVAEERIVARSRAKQAEMSNQVLRAMARVQMEFIGADHGDRSHFESLLDSVLELTGSEYGFLGEILEGPEGPYLKTWAITNIAWDDATRAFYETQAPAGLEFRNLDTLFGHTIRTGEMLITSDPYGHDASAGTPKGHPPLKTYAGIPLYSQGEFVAMLGMANRPGGYKPALLDQLTPLFHSVGNLIQAIRVRRSRDHVRERLEAVTRAGQIGTWELDLVTNTLEWDAITRAIHEVGADYVPTVEAAVEFYAEEARPEMNRLIDAAIAERSGWDIELPFRTATGRALWVRAVGSVVEEDGEVVRLLGSFQDVTERRNREEELRQVSSRLAISLEASSIGSWEHCLATNTHNWDETTRRLYGYPVDAPMPSTDDFIARVHKEDRARLATHIGQVFETGGSISENFRFMGWDGKERHIRSYGLLMERQDGPPILTGFNYDVTADVETARELDRRRQEAEAANLAKSQFLANMSHEIRTPLNGVLGMAQLLRLTTLDDKQSTYVETLRASGQALLDLIEDVLDIAKIESGMIEIREEPFDLGELVSDTMAIVEPVIRSKSLTLSRHADPDLPTRVVGDKKRTRQVLINMLGNAAKFTEAGSVSIEVRRQAGDRIRFDVTDTGPGIAADQHERVFDRFAQVDDSATRKHGGTGLGLAICRELVELAGGTIGVESVPGEGSRFWFELPLPAADSATGEVAGAAIPLPVTRKSGMTGRILVVDDVPTNQMVAAAFVRDAGFEVTLAENGQEALDRMAEARFDAVLMDMQMPVMSGEEAIRRIRASEADWSTVPIYAVTADATSGARDRYMDCGADGYLSKPLDRNAVIALLAGLAKPAD